MRKVVSGALQLRDELQYAKDDENDSRALRDAEIDEGRNQEKHQVLMVNKTTSFKKRAKGKKEELQIRKASKLPLP